MKNLGRFIWLVAVTAALCSCGLRSEVMFKAPKDFVFSELTVDSSDAEYRIQPNDVISFAIYTNEGAVILESSTGPADNKMAGQSQYIDYTVDKEGMVEFPVIGNLKVSDMTILEAQDFVEDKFETMFNRPYVLMRVLNRHVVVFTSPDGSGEVVSLGSQYVSIVEAIAMAGGLGQNAQAASIMLFRLENGARTPYLIDMSQIDGIKYAQTAVESGDIIYVNSRPQIPFEVAQELRPWLILISSLSVALTILARF